MGSQTLEILRQGVISSLTGGYFFDPYKNQFANAVHLYLYLFLLCTPFVTYMYSPATLTAWFVYCGFVVLLMATLKVINLNMHIMYDRAQILLDPKASVSHKTVGDDEVGIEMQVLGERVSTTEHRSEEISSAQSAISFEYPDPAAIALGSVAGAAITGQMDFKVDVHRKNSSESSDSVVYPHLASGGSSAVQSSVVVTHSAEICKNVVGGLSQSSKEAGEISSDRKGDLKRVEIGQGDVVVDTFGVPVNISSTSSGPKRRNKKRDAQQQKKKKRKTSTRDSSSSSDSRNDSSTTSSCGSNSNNKTKKKNTCKSNSSSSATSTSSSSNNRIYKYEESSGSSSSSSLYCTLKGATEGGSEGVGKVTEGSSKSGSKGAGAGNGEQSSNNTGTTKKRKKKRENEEKTDAKEQLQSGEGVAEDRSISSLPSGGGDNVIELDVEVVESSSSKEKSTGAKKKRFQNSRLQRQISLDTSERDLMEHLYFSMLYEDQRQRHRSTDDSEETCTNASNISLGNIHPSSSSSSANHHHHLHHHYHQYAIRPHLAYYTTKSELAIENIPSGKLFLMQPSTPMRKDSNSTMSAIQLPIATSSMATSNSCKIRRLSSGQPGVKHGAAGDGCDVDSPTSNVRRIKSAALDTGNGPATSYVSTQPNSVETITGRSNNSALPPPSKCLSRNPHLNLYPKKHSSHSSVAASGDPPVYPIAEHEVDEVVMMSGRTMMQHPLLNIRLPTSSSEDEGEEDGEEGDEKVPEIDRSSRRRRKQQIEPKSENEIRLEIEESNDEEEHDEDNKRTTESGSGVVNEEESSDLDCDGAVGEVSRNLDTRAPTTDSETENNGSQSPLLECGLKATSGRSNQRIVIMESGKLNGTVSCALGDGNSKPSTTGDGLVVDETMCRMRRKGAAKRVNKNPTKSQDSGFRSTDWDYVSASSKDMLLAERMASRMDASSQPALGSRNSPEPGPSRVNSERDKKKKKSKDGLEDDDDEMKDEEENPYVFMKPIGYQNQRRMDLLQTLVEADLVEVRRNAAREFRERVAPLTRGRAFRYHFQSGSQGSATGMAPLSTFFKQLAPDQEVPTSSSMEFNPFGGGPSGGTRWKLPDTSPFVRNMTTRSARYNNRRGRRQASFEGTASSSRDDFEHTTGAATASATSVVAGMESEFGSGTIGGGSIDTYTGIIEKMLSSQSQAVPGAVPAAAMNRVNDAMMDYIRYIKNTKTKVPKKYYKLPMGCCGWKREWKVSMDRLQLLALFDRDTGWFQVLLAIVLTALVAVLGSMILQMGFYADILAFIFCFVMAGSQYSLLKSVQPDAASPIHGFNKMVAFSRPIYFCLCAGLLIGVQRMIERKQAVDGEMVTEELPFSVVQLFGLAVHGQTFFEALRYALATVLLFFPLLFSLGLFPQINTFLMYFLEQMDMHVFGGNAVCGLVAGLVGIVKSILACFILYGLAYGGVIEPKATQHISFSIFCAIIVPISYHMSRCASDFTNIWTLIKSSLVMIHFDEDEEEENPQQQQKVEKSEAKAAIAGEQGEARKRSRSGSEEKLRDGTGEPHSEGHSLGIGAGKSSISLQPFPTTATNSQMSVLGDPPPSIHFSPPNEPPPIQERSDSTATNSSMSYMLRDGDPLPRKLQKTVNARLRHDLLVCLFMAIVVMALHCSTIFTVLQPEVNPALHTLAIVLGFVLHYLIPQMRKQWPWLCVAKPILRAADFGHFEAKEATKVSWFESTYVYLCFLERNVLYPVLFLSALTGDSPKIVAKFGPLLGTAIIVVCGLKGLRNAYSDTASQFMIVIFTVLFFQVDSKTASETFLVDYFLMSILYRKITEFLLKLQFIVTYIAPWQITWGSAFHAFAQPFSVPHSAMLFVQAGISAAFSTPLNPFLGSAIFITSYVRPIKFWERDYNTRRIDHSNTRLSLQLERDLGADDNNLNSIFYEHLTQSLQHSLCGDLIMGRWGQVSQGDCFVLASDYLNCLVHIIELGNGLCTFQIRGLEFRGTYCQQREVEAISEGIEDNIDCCCCAPGHIKNMLSVNAMFSARWLAWQVVAAQYVIEGYSISDNSATTLLTVYEFRRALITYYVKSVIFFVIRSGKLDQWLKSEAIQETLQMTVDPQFVDLDPAFNQHLDEDFDSRVSGITRNSFCMIYLEWIKYCYEMRRKEMGEKEAAKKGKKTGEAEQTGAGNQTRTSETGENAEERQKNVDVSALAFEAIEKPLVSLCFALTLLARRTLATASHGRQYSNFEFFLHGLHALFKGDFRITSPRDEWVFADMDLLHTVVAPAVRMSLKLHQDYFQNPEQFEDIAQLYTTICYIASEIVISHEADPAWRSAVLRGVSNLLALRHVNDDGGDEYRIIRLTKGFLSFRVIKLNRECVRGLWSGQQQELIYLRNRNPERGSIQNAKQALRNIINSSCDQPIGYPIYVSPLTTSYAETNEQLCKVIGGPVSFEKMRTMFLELCRRIRNRCHEGCSSGSSLDCDVGDMQGVYCTPNTPSNTLATIGSGQTAYGSQSLSLVGAASGGPLSAAATRGSLASMGKPYSSTLAGFLRGPDREMERESGRSSGNKGSKRSESRSERRATLPASTSNLNTVTSKSEMIMMMGLSSGSGASGSGAQPGISGTKENNTAESSSLTLNTSSNNFLNMSRAPNRKSLSFESKRGPVEREASNRATTSSDLSLPLMMPNIALNRKVIIVDAGEIYDCLDLGRRIDVNWPSDEMRKCGGRSSWRDWTPQVGMTGYVVHYWQPNHPDLYFRSNVNRTLLLLQIGNHFVPVGENGVKEYNTAGGSAEVRGQAASAENLNGMARRGRSRSRKLSDSIRKLKSEEEPVRPTLILPEEEKGESGKDEEKAEGETEERKMEPEKEDVVAVLKMKIEEEKKEEDQEMVEGASGITATEPEQVVVEKEEPSSSSSNLEEELARVRE